MDDAYNAARKAVEGFTKSAAMERDERRFDQLHGDMLADWPVVELSPNWPLPNGWEERINIKALDNETDSEIEYHMQRAMLLGGTLDRNAKPPIILRASEKPIKGLDRVQIIPQFSCSVYRLDFAVAFWGYGTFARVAVECDGHDFHERTKEQAAHDKQRDRRLAAAGWPVLRFAGSEIAANALSCAAEVNAALMGLQWDVVTGYRAGLAALHRREMERKNG